MKTLRPPYALAALVGGFLGFLIAVPAWRDLTRFPLDRVRLMADVPRPLGMLWWSSVRAPASLVDSFDRLIVAGGVLLMLAAFLVTARSLNPRFTLRLDSEAGRRGGGAAWLDVPLLIRLGIASLFSLWLCGAGWPIGELVSRSKGSAVFTQLAGGLPSVAGLLPGALHPIALALVLVPILCLIWGPGGLAHVQGRPAAGPLVPWALLAGVASLPGVLLLFPLRGWLQQAGTAFPLVDRSGWQALFWATLLLPALGGAFLLAVAGVFRPRESSAKAWYSHVVGAVALFAAGVLMSGQVTGALQRLDAGSQGLASRLQLQGSPLRRFALVMAPRGQVLASSPADSSGDGSGKDLIACSNQTHGLVLDYLRKRNFRTGLNDRAFFHLHACNSLDWISTQNLRVNLELLKRAPSPVVAQLLIEKLAACPITPDNKAVLDELADGRQFTVPRDASLSWFGMTYRRFGDLRKSREYFLKEGGSRSNLRESVGGISPLTDGVVRGRFLIPGEDKAWVRLGLVSPQTGASMLGLCPPSAWRWVLDLAYTDKDGQFEFKNVPEGEYLLVATGGGIGRDPRTAVVTPAPGVIRVDRFHPVIKLPRMELKYEGRPRRMPGETTAKGTGPTPRLATRGPRPGQRPRT